MDAVIEHVIGGKEPETLGKSWRSRPELVRLTSALFAPALESIGIPASRVRLGPAHEAEPPGLGTPIEFWRLESTNKKNDAAALAAAVGEFLADPKARVRDTRTKKTRRATAGDIAIFCRFNKTCAAVAEALESLGIAAVIPRKGKLVSGMLDMLRDGDTVLLDEPVSTKTIWAGRELKITIRDAAPEGRVAREDGDTTRRLLSKSKRVA